MKKIIHVGIEKTATTTLQEFLFARHREISYLGRPYGQKLGELVAAVYRDDSIFFDAKKWDAVARAELNRIRPEGKVVVLSEEFLASWITRDLGLTATRLRKLFGPAKIIITIRRQTDLLASLYADTIKMRRYQTFESWLEDGLCGEKGRILARYDFESLARYYESEFGEGNVGIFVFEELVGNVEGFARRISAFLGIDHKETHALLRGNRANPRKSGRLVRYIAWRSRFLPGIQLSSLVPTVVNRMFQRFIHRGHPAVVRLSPVATATIRAAFGGANRKLSAKYALDLERYGYPVD